MPGFDVEVGGVTHRIDAENEESAERRARELGGGGIRIIKHKSDSAPKKATAKKSTSKKAKTPSTQLTRSTNVK